MASKRTERKEDKTMSRAIGTGTGVVGGAAAGAAAGTAVVPGVGTVVGAVVGAVGGAAAGYAVSAAIDPAEEDRYWEEQYPTRPYYQEGTAYEAVRPAYRFGLEAGQKYPGETFEQVENRLKRQWPKSRGDSTMTWSQVRPAVADAYNRTIRLHEERLKVEKEEVETGEVGVEKVVVTENKKFDVPVEREEVVVKRKKVAGAARQGGLPAEPDEAEIRIPVKEERVRVSKETVPTEEVTVSRKKVRETKTVEEPVRHEEARERRTRK